MTGIGHKLVGEVACVTWDGWEVEGVTVERVTWDGWEVEGEGEIGWRLGGWR